MTQDNQKQVALPKRTPKEAAFEEDWKTRRAVEPGIGPGRTLKTPEDLEEDRALFQIYKLEREIWIGIPACFIRMDLTRADLSQLQRPDVKLDGATVDMQSLNYLLDVMGRGKCPVPACLDVWFPSEKDWRGTYRIMQDMIRDLVKLSPLERKAAIETFVEICMAEKKRIAEEQERRPRAAGSPDWFGTFFAPH
ncbi:MAG: hypothetical protein M3O22_07115 [Pseudomonadota bacterium]|nr:hypothetical protein [Pseudomonadota bacterium]